jgi:hypothetical protein
MNDGCRSTSVPATEVVLDVGLPQIEDPPKTELHLYQRGIVACLRAVSRNGGTFGVQGFTRFTNAATGRIEDRYLYSVKVKREAGARYILAI